MTQYLPPNLLALFAARDPLPFLQPYDKLPHEKKRPPFIGLSGFINNFEVSISVFSKIEPLVSVIYALETRRQKARR